MSNIVPIELIEKKIFVVRGQRIMLDTDLAELYGVTTKALNQAVKRNILRFPGDFMFQLTMEEKIELVTVCDRFKRLKHSTVLPHVFTEFGAIMLANVLRSESAVLVSIQVVRAFAKLREMLTGHAELSKRLDELESKYDGQFKIVFEAIRRLMLPQQLRRKSVH